MHIPTGWIAYSEACALIQDEIARRWLALAQREPDAAGRARMAQRRAAELRRRGGEAVCVMRI